LRPFTRLDRFSSFSRFTPLALAAALACSGLAHAQSVVTITGSAIAKTQLTGFGDTPLAKAPLQASAVGHAQWADAGISQFSGLVRLDASVADAYNAEGYWSNLAVRGFTLDNRYNYRRDGLPINAETAIALDNKERLELLKGISGMQAGTSAPGGLLNLVVKRPQAGVRELSLQWRQPGSLGVSLDLSERFGAEQRWGWRLNAASERLDPAQRNTRGERSMAALALDWQLSPDTLLQAEIESSRQSQPSVAGHSMLGNRVPDAAAIDRRLNLNDQAWRQPVVFNGNTASLRVQHRLSEDWSLSAHAMQQGLKSDDRTAFPYGVYDAQTYECAQWCDRFAPDGSFTYWQYISDNERRTSTAATLALAGRLRTGAVVHALEFGVLRSGYRGRFQDQVFDIAGTGNVRGTLQAPASAGFTEANTQRDESSTEWFVRDALQLGADWQLWAGARHNQLRRRAERTSPDSGGSLRATSLARSITTPWLALSRALGAKTMVYASWGKGLETDVAPNRSRYSNAGESLLLNSRQWELGVKHGSEKVEAALTYFDIQRAQTADIGACDNRDSCRRVLDGSARHSGVEAQWAQAWGALSWQASAMALLARRQGSQLSGVNGMRPANVPASSLRWAGEYRVAQLPGLSLLANLSAEGQRVVLPYDSTVRIGGWSRLDLGARWRQTLNTPAGALKTTWRVGLDNATDRRAWQESPYQFGHVYLYALPARTWRASVQFSL